MPRIQQSRIAVPGPQGVPGIAPEGVAALQTAVDRSNTRVFDARAYGLDYQAADNIAAINAAIDAASADGGGRVVIPTGKTFAVRPDPATANYIKLKSNVRLDLADATLRVANNAPPYAKLIGQAGSTSVDNAHISGGMVDQNPAGNTTANVTVAANQSNAINLSVFRGVLIDGVTFVGGGINTVVLSGPPVGAIDAAIVDSSFTFIQGASTTPNYDNSSIYLTASGLRVEGNRFYSTLAQMARGCCEFHGHVGSFVGNTGENYETLLNIVHPSSDPSPAIGALGIVVTGNTGVGLNYGIQVWPIAGKTMRGILIATNVIELAQILHALTGTTGIGVNRGVALTGDIEGLSILNNIIAFQAGDARTGMSHVDSFGVNTNGNNTSRKVVVAGNTILNAPAFAIKIGDSAYTTKGVDVAAVKNNLIVDAGQNPAMTQRAAIVVSGTLTDVRVRNNDIQDTGPAALVGGSSFLITNLVAGARNVYADNDVSTTSGIAMAASTADTYFRYRQKKQTIDLPSIAAGGQGTITFAVPGAELVDVVVAQPLQGLEAGLVYSASVTAADTVVVKVTNVTAAAIDPAIRVWRVRLLKSGIDA